DLIFVDLVMPGIDGIRLAREIRHKSAIAKRDAPIILITGHASRATVVAAVAAGIDDIIVKPVSPTTILRRVRRLLLKPPAYVSGVDGYFGPDVAERRKA
ncbi:response regulator, partial [Mycobacterium tuberculosis]|nr:response regulator [Mycobacterium tuberculosis]